ncbi:MAG TPA: aldehyde dehydrogenase family protein [Candidatus Acidoferrales bacterium]|nr:aldehyde dehydrogenase family protein [Candidatus Acidoferrales bacterium]
MISHWIGGRPVEGKATFDVYDPSVGTTYDVAADGGADEIDRAVRVAQSTYDSQWSSLTPSRRAALLAEVAARLPKLYGDLGFIQSRDAGKPISFVENRELPGLAGEFAAYASLMGRFRDRLHSNDEISYGLTITQPYGVVGVIVPFNAPLGVTAEKTAQALAAGNCVVIKPSPLAPASIPVFVRLLEQAGMPPGVVNVVQGSGSEAGQALCEHPLVSRISFTGSTAVGQTIVRDSAQMLKRVTLELSGKNPCLVFPDANLKAAAANAAFSAFLNAGQTCTSASVILVHREVSDHFCQSFIDEARALAIGIATDPVTELGPLISEQRRASVMEWTSPKRPDTHLLFSGVVPEHLKGWFVAPHVFYVNDRTDPLLQEEIFGPIVAIIPFDDEDEAVSIANQTKYGLASFLWTFDARRIHRIARRLQAGRVWVNTGHSIPDDMSLPAWKMSGLGIEGGLEGMESFRQFKTINVNLHGDAPHR